MAVAVGCGCDPLYFRETSILPYTLSKYILSYPSILIDRSIVPSIRMETFLQSLFQNTNAAAGNFHNAQPPFHNNEIPPASKRAIRQLPSISVTPDDLIDPNNRECCICLSDVQVKDVMCRMPYCGHLFHRLCIEDWLSRHCTCPICRVELETEDANYEIGRRERMMQRKHRFHLYELQRMAVAELKQWCRQLHIHIPASVLDKKDLIDLICKSDRVQVMLNNPIMKEFDSVAVLRAMSVGQLKREMLDCGVSYDPKLVIEKEDIIQIFVNSGRILLKHEDKNSAADDDQHMTDENEIKSFSTEHQESNAQNAYNDVASSSTSTNSNTRQQDAVDEVNSGIARLMRESVSSLKGMAAVVDVNISDCIEKREMAERIYKKVRRN